MNIDNVLTFMDAWMLTREEKDPSEAIERQEKRGQSDIVNNKRLPKKMNENNVPREIFWCGTTNDMNYEDKRKIIDQNIFEYTQKQYERIGIEIIDEYDDLFWNVRLPEGWEIKATNHTMWNELIDNKGRKRASFFYKAAFYDRNAFINFETRFHLNVTHTADPSEDYDIWKKSDLQGTIKDGDIIIAQTRCVPATEDYREEDKIEKELWAELETFMKDHWPEYENVHAYWD